MCVCEQSLGNTVFAFHLLICVFLTVFLNSGIKNRQPFRTVCFGAGGGAPRLRTGHSGCDLPPAARQLQPFESLPYIKIQQSPSSEGLLFLVPVVGLEPTRHRWQRILSPPRLPFQHTGL